MRPDTELRARGIYRGWPAICSTCMKPVDLDVVLPLIRRDLRVVHECGRLLHRGA
jgi:hypothetical protein